MNEKNYHIAIRVFLTIGLLSIFTIIVALPLIYNPSGILSLSALLKIYRTNYLLIFNLLFFLFPATIFLYTNLIDAIIWLLWIFTAGIFALLFFHSPISSKSVKKLVFDNKPYKLIHIPHFQIDALHKLAESNREATDKRLIPTVIFLGVIQFIGWDALNNALRINRIWDTIFQISTARSNALTVLLIASVFGILLALLFLSIISLVSLAANLVTQSVIIEACIVAKYEQEKQILIKDTIDKKNKTRKRFWTRLGEVLDDILS